MTFIRSSSPVSLQRVRLRLGREGEGIHLSHLQQIDAIRKSLILAKWPLAMSEGNRPKPKISFGPAISVGYESESEYFDVELISRLDGKNAVGDLSAQLPAGYFFVGVKSIPRFFPSLEETFNVVSFFVQSDLLIDKKGKWEEFLLKERFPIVKKKGSGDVVIDARPLVKSVDIQDRKMEVVMRFGPGRTLKPERVIQVVCELPEESILMGTPECKISVRRKQFYIEKQTGELLEP